MGKDKKRPRERSPSSSSASTSSDASASFSENEEDKIIGKKKHKQVELKNMKKKLKARKKKEKREKRKNEKGEISKEDYYNKNTEFKMWLVEKKGKYFDELSTSKAKVFFKKFVRKWNKGKLDKKFYRGIDTSDTRTTSTTHYTWKFADNLKPNEMSSIRSNVADWNAASPSNTSFSTFGKYGPAAPPPAAFSGSAAHHKSQFEMENEREEAAKRLKQERKGFKDQDKLVMEELAPKATGYGAKLEKKAERAYERKQKEMSPETSESFLMGGDNFKARIERRKRNLDIRKTKRMEMDQNKIQEYEAKEKAKMNALLEMARANRSQNSLWKS